MRQKLNAATSSAVSYPSGTSFRSARGGTVRADILRSFDELVRDCGGASDRLLNSVGLAPDLLRRLGGHTRISHRKVVALLGNAASSLGRPDFGLQLASRQAPNGLGGPLSIAMRNCATLGDAFKFCADHIYTYSDDAILSLKKDRNAGTWVAGLEMTLGGTLDQRQIIEHALLRTCVIGSYLTGGRVKVREVWFRHDPLGQRSIYRNYFRATVCFSRPSNAVFFDLDDDMMPIVGYDKEVCELATDFINLHWAKPQAALQQKVRQILLQHSSIASASTSEVAAALGMHGRTFQRHLKGEGIRFDAIKDEICRELALKYLQQTRIPLIRIASLLGYSGLSSFSRRCQHWFSRSPREMRRVTSHVPPVDGDQPN